MQRRWIGSAVCLACFAMLMFASLAHAEGFLQTQGDDMVDEKGQKVLLRGVGLGNYLLPEGYMWKFGDAGDRPRKIEKIVSDLIGQEDADRFWLEFRKNYITEADIRRIAELGFNSVRPALNARRFLTEGDNPVFVDEGFQLLDDLVRWCGKHNVYVIIDMHGAPGGQTGTNIDDSANDQPELFMDPKYEKRLIDLWVKIAERYKDEPTVAGYDLLNEPLPERTGAAAKYKKELEPLYRRITTAIREVDKKHMIILEGADWSNDWSVFSEPFAPISCTSSTTTAGTSRTISETSVHTSLSARSGTSPFGSARPAKATTQFTGRRRSTSRPTTSAGRSGRGRRWTPTTGRIRS